MPFEKEKVVERFWVVTTKGAPTIRTFTKFGDLLYSLHRETDACWIDEYTIHYVNLSAMKITNVTSRCITEAVLYSQTGEVEGVEEDKEAET